MFKVGSSLASGTSLVISSDVNGYNLFTSAGSPGSDVTVTLTINSGVWVGSTSTGTPALTISGFTAGSTIRIINNGVIAGCGGAGNGGNAGDTISLGNNVTIDNTSGYILAPGGGGGQGWAEGIGLGIAGADGGGGGGGQGSTGGGAGSNQSSGGSGAPAGTAAAGSRSSGGLGATGSSNPTYGRYGGGGGAGGGWGQPGDTSAPSSPSFLIRTGGAAGYAIRLNSKTVTWLGGNNPSQVIGSVA